MEDKRVLWMKELTYAALGLTDHSLFETLLTREDERYGKELVSKLNSPVEGKYSSALIVYPLEHDVEVEMEELEGKESHWYSTCTMRTYFVLCT